MQSLKKNQTLWQQQLLRTHFFCWDLNLTNLKQKKPRWESTSKLSECLFISLLCELMDKPSNLINKTKLRIILEEFITNLFMIVLRWIFRIKLGWSHTSWWINIFCVSENNIFKYKLNCCDIDWSFNQTSNISFSFRSQNKPPYVHNCTVVIGLFNNQNIKWLVKFATLKQEIFMNKKI